MRCALLCDSNSDSPTDHTQANSPRTVVARSEATMSDLIAKAAVFFAFSILGSFVGEAVVRAENPSVTVRENGWFVVAQSYPTNDTFLSLTAGHWGDSYNLTVSQSVNVTEINFRVFSNYGFPNATITQNLNATLYGSGVFTIYLDLGSSSLGSPVYTSIGWSCH